MDGVLIFLFSYDGPDRDPYPCPASEPATCPGIPYNNRWRLLCSRSISIRRSRISISFCRLSSSIPIISKVLDVQSSHEIQDACITVLSQSVLVGAHPLLVHCGYAQSVRIFALKVVLAGGVALGVSSSQMLSKLWKRKSIEIHPPFPFCLALKKKDQMLLICSLHVFIGQILFATWIEEAFA